MSFESLGLRAELLQAVSENGYNAPTPIQKQAIPPILVGRDIMGGAQTGTGKTAGFTLPLLHRLMAKSKPKGHRTIRALVLTPTRELAAQVAESVSTYGKHLPLRSTVIFGGVSINPQIKQLKNGIDILDVTEDYVHRIGRTGRAGNEGEAMSLVCVDELKLLKDIERLIKREILKVIIDDFEPDPSIKAEPIQNGRGRQQGHSSRQGHNGNRNSSSRNNARPGQARSNKRSRRKTKDAA